MARTRTVAQRNLDAEVRAVEEGHRALLQPGGAIRVVSDSHPGKHYVVTFAASYRGPVVFSCKPEGAAAYRDDHLVLTGGPGLAPCKHAALAARRLEREKLIVLDATGSWLEPGNMCPPAPESIDAILARFR